MWSAWRLITEGSQDPLPRPAQFIPVAFDLVISVPSSPYKSHGAPKKRGDTGIISQVSPPCLASDGMTLPKINDFHAITTLRVVEVTSAVKSYVTKILGLNWLHGEISHYGEPRV